MMDDDEKMTTRRPTDEEDEDVLDAVEDARTMRLDVIVRRRDRGPMTKTDEWGRLRAGRAPRRHRRRPVKPVVAMPVHAREDLRVRDADSLSTRTTFSSLTSTVFRRLQRAGSTAPSRRLKS